MFNILKTNDDINSEEYVIATYNLESTKSLWDAAWDLAVGQSVGNPNVRNSWETDELFDKYCCKIISQFSKERLKSEFDGDIRIGFPVANIDWEDDGISQLLCHLMGGQMDIDHITRCHLKNLEFPRSVKIHFNTPAWGVTGMRKFTNQYDKPLFGGIVKPKTGLTPNQLLDMTMQLVDGGVDFIKEDEILANPAFCKLEDRVELISNFLAQQKRKVIYCFCINGEHHKVLDRAKFVAQNGGNGVHINVWSGLGVYNSVRKLNSGLFIHFQKSGDRVFTNVNNQFSIYWRVVCQLAGLMGVDSIHAGMYGGYLSDSEEELNDIMTILLSNNVVPALSCGMHPGIVNMIADKFGNDFMANVGGAIHGHPGGTTSGAKAMRQAIDRVYGPDYQVAVEKWGAW